ncbi:Mur ligase family protein [Pigmentibacter sp. JX0631]|uniref:bifunctional folylpolyglutamate synthase/dihydrofolate synthase n=1 Tax=Pigmentibacter sp. JX0631 TaxID=2976982 RepID=UPI00246992C2|nr:Mur ligase family protein [Pigmentibacter sp. JX0631]WGL58571.1 Mur ligase family protein [Pigmentibacter sp. JX0631]
MIPGSHRLHLLLKNYLKDGVLNIPSVIVAGSNGKGTTCAFIESILRSHGFKTGLYTSPHLIHPNERIRINGIPLSEDVFEKNLLTIIAEAQNTLPDASLFEILTATSLFTFKKEDIDFLVCEVGLGGLLDSTNCISPLVSVVTSITLEHTEVLGDSEEKIAADKSYVSRRNRPVILGDLSPSALSGAIKTIQLIGAIPKLFSTAFNEKFNTVFSQIKLSNHSDLTFANLNIANLKTALLAIQEIELEIQYHLNKKFLFNYEKTIEGIKKTQWPGRFDIRQIENRTIIFDASHNPDGFEFFLQEYKRSEFSERRCTLVFASLSDKDWKKTLRKIPEIAHTIYVTEMDSPRSELSKNILEYFHKLKIENQSQHFNIFCYDKYEIALEAAMNQNINDPIVITGSIAFIGLAMERFGLSFLTGN